MRVFTGCNTDGPQKHKVRASSETQSTGCLIAFMRNTQTRESHKDKVPMAVHQGTWAEQALGTTSKAKTPSLLPLQACAAACDLDSGLQRSWVQILAHSSAG